jgi:threonine aldolase
MMSLRIDLHSDTKTKPSAGMLEAMARAEVGDEQLFEDPTVNALCERVAELLGFASAMFLPSGTMCNQISAAVLCRPGDEIIADHNAHILTIEGAGTSVIARAAGTMIAGQRGVFSGEQLEATIRPVSRYAPRSRLVAVEQTANFGGGTIWPIEVIGDVVSVAKRHDLLLHMDGARLLNAVVASGIDAKTYCDGFDAAWIDFSKGLGAPVGAVLAGDSAFIEEAWRWKQRMGGAMRQAGILAAAALYALDHNVDRLADDHANAKLFADKLTGIQGLSVDAKSVETNIVLIDVSERAESAPEMSKKLRAKGVRIGAIDATTLRAVTHLDVGRDDVLEAAGILAELAAGGAPK